MYSEYCIYSLCASYFACKSCWWCHFEKPLAWFWLGLCFVVVGLNITGFQIEVKKPTNTKKLEVSKILASFCPLFVACPYIFAAVLEMVVGTLMQDVVHPLLYHFIITYIEAEMKVTAKMEGGLGIPGYLSWVFSEIWVSGVGPWVNGTGVMTEGPCLGKFLRSVQGGVGRVCDSCAERGSNCRYWYEKWSQKHLCELHIDAYGFVAFFFFASIEKEKEISASCCFT